MEHPRYQKAHPILNSFSPHWEVIKPKLGKQAATSLFVAAEKRLPMNKPLYTLSLYPECKHQEI